MGIEHKKETPRARREYTLGFSNPYAYATYADALAAIPTLSLIDNAEDIYNLFYYNYMPIMIDSGRYGTYTAAISFNLNMFFFTQYVEGLTNDEFYPDDYESVSGAIASVTANKVSTTYATNTVSGNWESSLNQNDFGVTYLMLAKAANLAIGIDGYGNPFCAI